MPILLQRTVSLGLVHGVMAPITPNGPISINVSPLSPDHAVVVISSVPGVFSANNRCFRILCSTFPIPVSSTPILAINSACSIVFFLILLMIASLTSKGILCTMNCAFFAASIASFISSKTPSCFLYVLGIVCEVICLTTSLTTFSICFSSIDTLKPPLTSIFHTLLKVYLALLCHHLRQVLQSPFLHIK